MSKLLGDQYDLTPFDFQVGWMSKYKVPWLPVYRSTDSRSARLFVQFLAGPNDSNYQTPWALQFIQISVDQTRKDLAGFSVRTYVQKI